MPESDLQVATCDDPAAWDRFVRSADGPPFALWGWARALETYDHETWPLVVREGGTIVGALPLHLARSRLFGSKLVSPMFGERGSVLTTDASPEPVTRLLLDRVRSLAEEQAVDFVSLRGRDLGDYDGFERRTRFVTFRIPVDGGAESIWDAMESSRRGHVRKARENSSLEFAVGDSVSDLREYYRLHLETMRGHGTPPHSFRFFRTLWDELWRDGNFRLTLVRKDGDPINGVIDLASDTTVHQWSAVSDYAFRDLDGGSLLTWKSLEWAAENGYDAYELGRTREGSGVYSFKKSFGGEKTWYDDFHYFPRETGTLPDPEREVYEPIKRAWRRLPIPVTRAIGPKIRGEISL